MCVQKNQKQLKKKTEQKPPAIGFETMDQKQKAGNSQNLFDTFFLLSTQFLIKEKMAQRDVNF